MCVTVPIGHAVEEEPGRVVFAILHEGHVVAGFDAQDREELHLLAGDAAVPPVPVRQVFGERHRVGLMIQPLGMKVDLKWNRKGPNPLFLLDESASST